MKADDRYDLGVLFVHGIGSQKRGQHLVQMGEALTRWLDWWIRAEKASPATSLSGDRPETSRRTEASGTDRETSRAGARIMDSRLTEDGEPARAVMEVVLDPTGKDEEESSRWLLAESHWAGEFLPPSFLGLCRWGLYAVPWTLAFHLGGRVRRLWRRGEKRKGALGGALRLLDLVRILVLLAAFPILAPVAMIVILALLLLALLPIPWLRGWIGTVQRTLAGTVGDSLILLESPIQAAAVVGRTVRDIEWVAERCRRVAIVAHSQGAAVAHEALATGVLAGRYRKDHLLFTYGSGLAKLEGLRALREGQPRWAGWVAPGALLLGLVSLVLGGWLGRGLVAEPSPWAGGFFGLVSLGMLWFGVTTATAASRLDENDAKSLNPARRFGIGLRWCDRWAAADPVPSGPLFDEGECPPFLVATEDENLGSLWRDHTAYHRNPDGFMAGLAVELTRLVGLDPVLREGDGARLRLGAHRRQFRVRAQTAVRRALLVATIAVPAALAVADVTARLGERMLDRVTAFTTPLPAAVAKLVRPVERFGSEGIGLVAVALVVLAAYGLVAMLWLRIDRIDERAFFERRSYRLGFWWWLWSLAVGTLAAAVMSAVLEPFRVGAVDDGGIVFTYWIYLGLVFLVSFFGLGLAWFFDLLAWRRVLGSTDQGFLLGVAQSTVWAYAVTVAPALVLWRTLPRGSEREGMILLVGVAVAGVVGVLWGIGRSVPRLERLAAVGDAEAALRALEPDAPCLTEANPPPSEVPPPPGPG